MYFYPLLKAVYSFDKTNKSARTALFLINMLDGSAAVEYEFNIQNM
jgi:hypothetical protein